MPGEGFVGQNVTQPPQNAERILSPELTQLLELRNFVNNPQPIKDSFPIEKLIKNLLKVLDLELVPGYNSGQCVTQLVGLLLCRKLFVKPEQLQSYLTMIANAVTQLDPSQESTSVILEIVGGLQNLAILFPQMQGKWVIITPQTEA